MLVSLGITVELQSCSHISPINDGGALTAQPGAGYHVHHGLQLGLQQDPLVLLVELLGHQVCHLVGEDLSGAALGGTVEVGDRPLSYPDYEVGGHAVLAVDVVTAQELQALPSNLHSSVRPARYLSQTNLVSEANVTAVERHAEPLILLHLIEFPQ